VYYYNDVCALVEGAEGIKNVDSNYFLLKSPTGTPTLKKTISYSYARVYILFIWRLSRLYQKQVEASTASQQRFYSNQTFNEQDLQKLHFIPKSFSPIKTLHTSSHNITNSYYDFCHVWWTSGVHYLLCIRDYFVVCR
jgi:hypothetical protein